MPAEEEFAVDTAGAMLGFNFGRLFDEIDQTVVVASGTAGDLQVDPDSLINFYSQLSSLHDKLTTTITTLSTHVSKAPAKKAGGLLPGAKDAWTAIVDAAGAGGSSSSLVGNLKSVDNLVLGHMLSLKQTLDAYAANEGSAVVGFGKVSSASAAGASGASKQAPTAASSGAQSAGLG